MSKFKEDPTTKNSERILACQSPLNGNVVFKEGGLVDWLSLRSHLKKEGQISEADFKKLIKIATILFSTNYFT